MIGQITPLVKVASREIWCRAVIAHTTGCVLSAVVLGLVLGIIGQAAGLGQWKQAGLGAVAIVLLLGALQELSVLNIPLPRLERQTPKKFLCAFGSTWGPFAWGLDLGQGWTTRIEYAGYYGVVLWALLTASPFQGALLLGAFGTGRILPVVLAGTRSDGDITGTLGLGYLLHSAAIHRINGVALAFLGTYLAVSWFTN